MPARAAQARHMGTFGIRTRQRQAVPTTDGCSRKGTKAAKTEVFAQRPGVIVLSDPHASYLANTRSLTLERRKAMEKKKNFTKVT